MLQFAALLVMFAGCGSDQLRFERVGGGKREEIALPLASFEGLRDGDAVRARLRLQNSGDFAELQMILHLGPPAAFQSGTYQVQIGGQPASGSLSCLSLKYLGGQNATPSVGGVFVLNDPAGQPLYQLRLPATPMQRRSLQP